MTMPDGHTLDEQAGRTITEVEPATEVISTILFSASIRSVGIALAGMVGDDVKK